MNSLPHTTARGHRSTRGIALSTLILGASLALAAPSLHATTISSFDEVYVPQDAYETGMPEGYYLDTWEAQSLDFLMGAGTWTASYPIIVAYNTGNTITFTLTSTTLNTGAIYIGYKSSSTGTMTLTSSYIESTSDITVGLNGTGTLQATNSTLRANNLTVGKNSGSTGTLTLNKANLSISDTIYVGTSTGHLTASNESRVFSLDALVACEENASGGVTLTGSGTIWGISHTLTLGYYDASKPGIGSILIEDDALLYVGTKGEGVSLSVVNNGSVIKLDGGYFAIYGDVTANEAQFLDDANLQVWDGTQFIDATIANTNINYYSTGEWAAGDALYTIYGSGLNLTGYTVISSAVPEPATYALFGGLGAVALVFFRKRRK